MSLLKAILLLSSLLIAAPPPGAEGARILAFFGCSSQSHNNFFNVLTTELANRGHEVTIVTPYPLKNPPKKNYRQIEAKTARDVLNKVNTVEAVTESIWTRLSKWRESAEFFLICNKVLQLPEVTEFYILSSL